MEHESHQVFPADNERLAKWGFPITFSSVLQRKTIILQPPKDLPDTSSKRVNGITSATSTGFQINVGKSFSLYTPKANDELLTPTELMSFSEKPKCSVSEKGAISNRTKKIAKRNLSSPCETKGSKKVYEISRFFVKNYVGALKSTIHNPHCEVDIIEFLGCSKEDIIKVRKELDKLLAENPKHNRMQMYKVLTNPLLNPVFQYFLRKKVFSWIFTSSKMQDRYAHLMARKNFLYLCLKAKELTPFNFRIALN